MPKELRMLWRIVEKTHPRDAPPLLALADKLEERAVKDDLTTAYALKWMAERNKRPEKDHANGQVWSWYEVNTQGTTVPNPLYDIPVSLHINLPGGRYNYPTFRIAVRALGKALRRCL